MSLTEPLHQHHKYCDDQFAEAEAAVSAADWVRGRALLHDFSKALETHFCAEEETLFPAFETASGMTGGPTQMMRFEHAQMRGLLDQMATAIQAEDGAGFAGCAETLLILMQQHNMKEENILYPMCDRSLAAQADTLRDVLRERLDAACLAAE